MALIKKYLKIFIIILLLVGIETILYELARVLSRTPYTLSSALDNSIPFIAEFIYPYIFWYLMIIITPFFIYLKNKNNFIKYCISCLITCILGFIIFIIFPTTVERPLIEVNNTTNWLVNTIYTLDTPSLCCLPSMHCALCFLMIIYSVFTKDFSIVEKIILFIILISIILSTLFIKQHVIIDAILALIITVIVCFAVEKFNLDKFICKLFSKINNKFFNKLID